MKAADDVEEDEPAEENRVDTILNDVFQVRSARSLAITLAMFVS